MKLKNKIFLLVGIVVLIAIALIEFTVYRNGYNKAMKAQEEKVAELESEKKELSKPTATYEQATSTINIRTIESDIHEINELVTMEYAYTNAGQFSDSDDHIMPWMNKSFIMKYDGVIKAGINWKDVVITSDDASKIITVIMPKSAISSHEIDPNSYEVLDEKDSVFNKISLDDTKNFEIENKELMEQKAIDNGLLEKADKNARLLVENMLISAGVKEAGYTIEFK